MTFLMEQCKKCLAHIFYFLEKNTCKYLIWKENLSDFQKIYRPENLLELEKSRLEKFHCIYIQ